MNDVEKVLTDAQELISKGWCKGTSAQYNPAEHTMEYCIMGALDVAWNNKYSHADQFGSTWQECLSAVNKQIWAVSDNDNYSIPKFNDSKNTSKEDVLLVFKKAIASVGEKQ